MSEKKTNHPPSWADLFLQWYCRPDLLEEIQGDAYEIFYRLVDDNQARRAKWSFIWNVLRFLRPSNIRKTKYSNNTTMVKNYFKLGFRGMLKNKLPAAINIIGLAVSIGIVITAFMFVDFYLNMDKFHEKAARITYVQSNINKSLESQRYGSTPANLANFIIENEITAEAVVRFKDANGIIRFGEEVYYERFRFTDPDFHQLFTFPLAYGSPAALKDPSKVIISKQVAERFFDKDVPLGQIISITIDNQQREFEIGGVAKKFPANASFSFNILIPFENYDDWTKSNSLDWSENVDATFVLLKEGEQDESLVNTLAATITSQNEANQDNPIESYHLEPLVTASRNGYDVNNNILFTNHPAGIFGASFMAACLLLLTCINYTNIAVSAATGRLKEIALRKVIGGRRKELIAQFLVENLILCSLALLVGIGLTEFFFLPGLNSAVPVTFPFVLAPRFWIFIGVLLLSTCLISGAYPALYISKFQPVEIFRKKEKLGKSMFSKVMLTLQFAFAFNLIISALVFNETEEYQKSIDWGYNKEQKIVLPVQSPDQYRNLADAMAQNPDVQRISGAKNHFGRSAQRVNIAFDNEQYEVRLMESAPDYLDFMGVNLLEGSFFDQDRQSDYVESVIINETMMTTLGWESWQGKVIRYDSVDYQVTGLIQDFHFNDFYTKIYPAMFKPVRETELRFLVANIGAGSVIATEEFAREVWKKHLPDMPYAGFFQNTVFDRFFTETKANADLNQFLGLVAVILSCMGLYGLVSFTISKRMKELSVRKILGADSWSIFKQVNKGFVLVLLLALLLAAPLTYFMMSNAIPLIYEYYQPLGFSPFLNAFIAMLFTMFLTISGQIIKVYKTNPVQTLKEE